MLYDLRGHHALAAEELAVQFRNNQAASGRVGGFATWGVYTPGMLCAVAQHFLPAFLPLTERHIGQPFTEADRETQLIHRGLYAEYNLVYDRGTRFGLETGHDINAVLMSLPPIAKWI